MIIGAEVSLAAEPIVHGYLQSIEGNTVSTLEQPVGNRESVVKGGVVGEIAHGKVVDPAKGAGMTPAFGIEALDGELAREHGFTVRHCGER